MKNTIFLLILIFTTASVKGQSVFELKKGKKEAFSFTTSANLMIVPATVNGVEMNFILDTGSARSVIFDFVGIDSLNVKKGKVVKYKGAGSEDFFEAYYSPHNVIKIGSHIYNNDAEILMIINASTDFKQRLGVDVNGIIGADFFKQLMVYMDYEKERITVFKQDVKLPRRIRKSVFTSLQLHKNKPYLKSTVVNDKTSYHTNVLIDTGSSDSLWLYSIDSTLFDHPYKGFEDYLGYGLSGDIYGFRSKIDRLKIAGHELEKPTTSFPKISDSIKLKNKSQLTLNVKGSIGGEVLRRFNVFMDYKKERALFMANSSFKEGFYYNMSGLQLKIQGVRLTVSLKSGERRYDDNKLVGDAAFSTSSVKTYKIIPNMVVADVREGSPAYLAGIRKEDLVIEVNGKNGKNLSLKSASKYFYKNPYKIIKLTYQRGESIIKTKFELIPLIE